MALQHWISCVQGRAKRARSELDPRRYICGCRAAFCQPSHLVPSRESRSLLVLTPPPPWGLEPRASSLRPRSSLEFVTRYASLSTSHQPHAPPVGAGAAPPPNPSPRPANGSHRLPNTLGQVGEQYGPSIAPFARARCPFSPL
jgi:hypothetical protein